MVFVLRECILDGTCYSGGVHVRIFQYQGEGGGGFRLRFALGRYCGMILTFVFHMLWIALDWLLSFSFFIFCKPS